MYYIYGCHIRLCDSSTTIDDIRISCAALQICVNSVDVPLFFMLQNKYEYVSIEIYFTFSTQIAVIRHKSLILIFSLRLKTVPQKQEHGA